MKERWYYPHEEYFFWALTLVTFLVAWSLGGVYFIASLFAGAPCWGAVYLFWYLMARS